MNFIGNFWFKALLVFGAIVMLLYLIIKIMRPYRNFTFEEFDSPDENGSGEKKMNRLFLEQLDKAASDSGIKPRVTSGYRSAAHNVKVGGVPNSNHTKGLAADLVFKSKEDEYKFTRHAIKNGLVRFGIGAGIYHIEYGSTKLAYGYPKGTPIEYNPFNLV